MSETAVVVCRNLAKTYRPGIRRRVEALSGLGFEVRRGTVFALVGPNGSGKTTTLKLLTGLARPTSGEILLWGASPTDRKVRARMGFLPEESYLPRFLTGREALDFYARLFGMDRATRRARVADLLSRVGLASAADRPIREYSKGMARRVGLAQALVNDPELVILDEPTSGLDPVATREVKDLIGGLARAGKTVIVSSHLLADLESVCEGVVILAGGRPRVQGTVRDLLTETRRLLIEVEGLAPDRLSACLDAIAAQGGRVVRSDHPRRTLEAVFLDAVGRPPAPPV